MKKLVLFSVCVLIITVSFAQVQRKAKTASQVDSAGVATTQRKEASRGDKMKMMKELNLTKEQKGKLKEIRQVGQSKKQAIESDETLKPEQKQAKLKELKKEQAKSTMSILTDEQKAKMMQLRKEKKMGEGEDDMQMEEN